MRKSRYAIVRAIEGRSYRLAKWGYHLRLRRHVTDPVVVFAMGKTGTTALAHALRQAGCGPVFQVHNLAFPERLEQDEALYRAQLPNPTPFHIWDAQWLREHLPSADHPWVTVTAVRDPIRRTVATFFESAIRMGHLTTESTVSSIEEHMRPRWEQMPLNWFNVQFKATLDVDVLAHPFDPAQGYGVIDSDHCRVLVVRQEDLAAKGPEGLGKLLGATSPVHIRPHNVGDDKEYAEIYRTFIRRVRPPAAALDRAYGSDLVRHFYSADEIERFREFWTGSRPA